MKSKNHFLNSGDALDVSKSAPIKNESYVDMLCARCEVLSSWRWVTIKLSCISS